MYYNLVNFHAQTLSKSMDCWYPLIHFCILYILLLCNPTSTSIPASVRSFFPKGRGHKFIKFAKTIYVICFSVYLNKHLKLYVTIIVSDNFSVKKTATNHFLYLKFKKFNACAEPKVGISTQDGRMGYLSLISDLREGTSLEQTYEIL